MSRLPTGLVACVCIGLVFGSGCRAVPADPPEGFAELDTWGELRAVSPDGVVYRVRRDANEPKAELNFWKEALKKRMIDAGYGYVAEQDVRAGERAGYLLELAAPMGSEDYSYVVAIFPTGKHVVIAEAAGEVGRYKARAKAVVKAIEGMKL